MMKRGKMLGLFLVITILVGTIGVVSYLYNEQGTRLREARELIAKQDARLIQYQERLTAANDTIIQMQTQSAKMIAVEKKLRMEAEQSYEEFKSDIDKARQQALAIAQQEAQAKENAPAPKTFKFLKTKDGKTLYKVKILDITDEGVTLIHAQGGGKIPYSVLPDPLVQLFQAELKKDKG